MATSVGIVVSGGPAPGINSVIHAAVIHLSKSGFRPIGIRNGFRELGLKGASSLVPLDIDKVSRIADDGGSMLGTSRFNPLRHKESEERSLETLERANIKRLIVIGGEGSAYLSHQFHLRGFKVVHVPKTIDNDLPLPADQPSFGYETAREIGSHIVQTLMTDAKTCSRWYIAETMGRQAGFLALGSGVASGATATFIPEEFSKGKISADALSEMIFESIQIRYRSRRRYGVILLAEGLLDCIDPASDEKMLSCPTDELGRLTYSELELGDVVIPRLKQLAKDADIPLTLKSKSIGYELRCGRPIPFDLEYTKFLGYAAAERISEESTGVMVVRKEDHIEGISLEDLFANGSIEPRVVDLSSDSYRVARELMIR